jgi:hypothetical protein
MPERALEAPLWAIIEVRLHAIKAAERAKVLNGIRVHFIRGPEGGIF